MTEENLFDFKVINSFNEIYFKDLLQKSHLNERELFIQELKTPESKEGYPEMMVNDFFFELNKDGKSYLLPSKWVEDLPLYPKEYERVGYKGNGYRLIRKPVSAKFKPEKKMSFRSLVNKMAHFEHTTPKHFLLYKIIVLAGLIDRINFRCSSKPAFGKDSFISIASDLFGNIGVVQNPTIAKLEFLTFNKLIMCNEVVNLEPKETRDIEQYLLSTGDFDNKYTKRSRGSRKHGSREDYDISKLSLFIAYNNKDCYKPGTKYFDDMFQSAVPNRFPAFKFNGVLTEKFPEITDPKVIALENKEFFVSLIRTFQWYKKNWQKELKNFTRPRTEFGLRHDRVFATIFNFIDLYAKDEDEFRSLNAELMSCYSSYSNMIKPQKKWDETFVKEVQI